MDELPAAEASAVPDVPPRGFSAQNYGVAAALMFLATAIAIWENAIHQDEEIYFIGPHRIADPSYLAHDFTWNKLSPTTALFDHLVAPLWRLFDPFTLANIGRAVFWGLLALSIVRLARAVRLPAWAAAVGYIVWVFWGQTLGICGTPLDGFQVKSFAYPLIFVALADAIRGRTVRAGLALGLATAFHIIVGGWALLALLLAMLVQRRLFTLRQTAVMLLVSLPFVVPLVAAVMATTAHVSAADQRRMDDIYVMFSMPHCCDVFYFLSSRMMPLGWVRAAVVFVLAPIVLFAWPERRAGRLLGSFVVMLIAFFLVGVVARAYDLNGVLKTYPFQLGNALPALFLFMFVVGWLGVPGAGGVTLKRVRAVALLGAVWLAFDRGVPRALWEKPVDFVNNVRALAVLGGDIEYPVFSWIRDNTPKNSVFITPLISEFWPYAERAQVASMRQPPLDHRLLEWKERLEAMNGFRPFVKRGWETTGELEVHERELSVADLIRIRNRYGATHYMILGVRPDLAKSLIHTEDGYSIFDISHLAPLEPGR